jgi:hypothetical protein
VIGTATATSFPNVIGSNGYDGIAATGGIVRNNYIGALPTGEARPNGTSSGANGGGGGIQLFSASAGPTTISSNTIATNNGPGTYVLGPGLNSFNSVTFADNIVRGNAGAGLEVKSGNSGIHVIGGSFAGNAGLGIDLGVDSSDPPVGDGPTANDPGDGDDGPNNLQNFPVITAAEASAGGTTVRGTLDSVPSSSYDIQLYSDTTCDPSGYGEGANLQGSVTATTDSSGHAAFSTTLANSIPVGAVTTATATATDGNTSEFSLCQAVTAASPPPPPPPPSADLRLSQSLSAAAPVAGQLFTYALDLMKTGPASATTVRLTAHISKAATIRSATAEGGSCAVTPAPPGVTVSCLLGTMATGEHRTTKILAVPTGAGATDFRGDASSDQPDPTPATASDHVDVLPPPVLGKFFDVVLQGGRVLVRPRGSHPFTTLAAGERLQLGSTIDATHGHVSITSASDSHGHAQTASFYEGRFVVTQTRSSSPITDLTLNGGTFRGCAASADVGEARRRSRRHLFGSGKGRFRTRGRSSSATVRGTQWLTEDRCDGTLVKVIKGVVAVRDFARHRTVRVRAGHSYLAKARDRD